MKRFALYLFFLLCFSPLICFSQLYHFEDTKINTTIKDYKKVLLVGIGTVETRMFFETISASLVKEFESRNVESSYSYLGKDPKLANEQIKKLLRGGCDAIIVFTPLDSAFSAVYNSISTTLSSIPLFGDARTSIAKRNLIYTQDLCINLLEATPPNPIIWSVNLSLNFDPSERSLFPHIIKRFVRRLKDNKILN